MNFAVNAPIMFIFQKGAGKRRKGNKPIITRICLLSFCFWVLRPPLVSSFHARHDRVKSPARKEVGKVSESLVGE